MHQTYNQHQVFSQNTNQIHHNCLLLFSSMWNCTNLNQLHIIAFECEKTIEVSHILNKF